MTSVVILGLAKSGTSALYADFKRAFPGALTIYEPSRAYQFDFIKHEDEQDKIVKVLYPIADSGVDFGYFDKRILMVRDPRDCVLSLLLYKPLLGDRFLNEPFVDEFVARLEQKERDPQSVRLIDFVEVLANHGYEFKSAAEHRQDLREAKKILEAYPDTFIFSYEDYVSGRVAALEDHVGLSLSGNVNVSAHLFYNARAKRIGDWRQWFTPEDVAWLKPLLQPYMDWFGYGDDWRLTEHPVITATEGSGYVRRSAEKLRRLQNRFGELREKEAYTPEYVQHLLSAAEDGAEGAMVELGLIQLFGYVDNANEQDYLRWMGESARRGNPLGLVHWGVGIEQGWVRDGTSAADHFRRSAAIRGNPATKRTMARIRTMYAEMPLPEFLPD